MQQEQDIELYDFVGASDAFYLTPHEFALDTVRLGDREFVAYESVQLSRSALRLDADGKKAAIDITMPPDHPLVAYLLQASIAGAAMTIAIRNAVLIGDEWFADYAKWFGRVIGVELADEAAKIRCEHAQISLKRIGLRRLYSRICSHVLYSAACGATPRTASASVNAIAGRVVTIAGRVPAAVSGALSGGWMETATGQRHMIETADAGSVTLLYPSAGVSAGDSVTLVAGCDHTVPTCASRFGNLDNFGGFPFIPAKNPFSTGVF